MGRTIPIFMQFIKFCEQNFWLSMSEREAISQLRSLQKSLTSFDRSRGDRISVQPS